MSVSKIVSFPNSLKGTNFVTGNTCKEALHSSLNLFPTRRQEARSHVTCQDRKKESEEKKMENFTSTKSDRVIHQSIPSITCTARFETVEFYRFCQFGSVHVANVFLWLGKARQGNYGRKHQHFQCETSFF